MRLLIVVDYQNDFVTGALGFPKALEIEKYIVSQIKLYEEKGDMVIFTQDIHDENYLDSVEGKYLPVRHCLKKETGKDFYGEVAPLAKKHLVMEKHTFGSDILLDYLRNHHYTEITLLGIVSNMCVLANAIIAKTAQPNTPIIIDKRGSASYDEPLEAKAYEVLKNLHFVIKE